MSLRRIRLVFLLFQVLGLEGGHVPTCWLLQKMEVGLGNYVAVSYTKMDVLFVGTRRPHSKIPTIFGKSHVFIAGPHGGTLHATNAPKYMLWSPFHGSLSRNPYEPVERPLLITCKTRAHSSDAVETGKGPY